MGASTSLFRRYFKKRDVKLLFVGLDAAGKTTTLYRLKLGEVVTTIPTIGFNVETIEHKNVNITTWDVGGRGKIRALWRHYMQGINGLIVMVDSNDAERFEDLKEQVVDALADLDTVNSEAQSIPVLVYANKQDLPNAKSIAEIEEKINFQQICGTKHPYKIFPSVATDGSGLYEGLDWLCDIMTQEVISSDAAEAVSKTVKPVQHTATSLQSLFSSFYSSMTSVLSTGKPVAPAN